MRLSQSFASLWPASLSARMAAILLVGIFAAQGVSFWLHWSERATVVSEARGLHMADRIADAVRRLEADPTPGHARALAALQSDELRVTAIAADQVLPHVPRGQIGASIAAQLGSEREIRSPGGMAGMGRGGMGGMGGMGRVQRESAQRSFDVRLQDGQWVRIVAAREAPAPALPANFIAQLIVSLAIVGLVAVFAVRQAAKPLQQLAQAADSLGRDLDAPPLAEAGSTEMRSAAQAFNRMRERLRRLIDERSRALAAVSHDLRTPLTRLRLRAELIENDKLREQIGGDLDAMAQMIDATLGYLRGLQENEPARLIDINALLDSLAEDFAALGKPVGVEGRAVVPYRGRLSGLRRALQNLIDNACKYGRSPRVCIADDASALRLAVEDDGPGIPPKALGRVTEPYYRPDAARAADSGGVGLGLSIVKDVAVSHGGELILANRPQGGLSATLVLPRQGGERAAQNGKSKSDTA